jgi:UDP-N-acetylmuramoyl-L-alanyl-D-glutamate--2,6-diaminopimelate ligase
VTEPVDATLGADPARPAHPRSTRLADLAASLSVDLPAGADNGADNGAGEVLVTGLSLSSQRVRPGDLYAALPGSRAHGASFARDAVAAGAVAVLTDPVGAGQAAGLGVPVVVVDSPRAVLGALAARVYGEPGADLVLLGVTGTQGKTTTTRLLEAGLTRSGTTAAVVGTVGTRIAGHEVPTALTTPEAPDLHALFAVMREQGVRACAMEVSSHALVLGRVDGVLFDVAAFTNLGRDHLDFHPSVEDYFAAKASLFTADRSRRGLTNVDDEHGRLLLERAEVPMATFSARGAEADWRIVDVVAEPHGSRFRVIGPDVDLTGGVRLPGGFNVANALCAIALAGEAGLDAAAVAGAIAEGGGVPGRFERIDAGQDFVVVVDYAHKPDAVTAALEALRPVTRGRLVLVLGAGGDRDRGKRPVMGEIGARLADVLVVTDDNPRTEDPAAIRAEIVSGATSVSPAERAEVVEMTDRREAIRWAVRHARPGDAVLVAGKGHETGQEVDGVVHPFDDRAEVRAALEELGAS